MPRLPQVAIQQDGATLSPGSVCVDFVHYGSNPSFNGTLSVGTVPGTTPLVTNYLRLPPTAHVEHVAYFQVPPVPIPGATYFAETYTSPAGHQPIVVPNNPALIGGEVFVQPVAVVLDTLANESFVVFDKATHSVIGTSQPTF